MDQKNTRAYALSLSNEVNMTNCYKHCKHFFESCERVHFNVLIAYWMMAGYLGHVDSVEEAYQKGHGILLDLIYEKKIIKPLEEDREMVEFDPSDSELKPCRHEGFCIAENLGFVDLLDLGELGNVVCTDGILKTAPRITEGQQTVPNKPKKQRPVLLIDGNHLSRQVFHPPKRLKYLAYFNPRPNSLEPLLKNVTQLSMLLLRGCELLPQSDLSFEKFKTLIVLEISGSSHLATIPEETISQLTQLRCLNLSDLLIEKLPDDFFNNLVELRWVILRGLSKLVSLPTIRPLRNLQVFDLFHCTNLKELKSNVLPNPRLQLLDLSYTAMSGIPALRDTKNLTHLFLRDSKVNVLNSLKQLSSLLVLDLSGAQKVIQVTQLKGNRNLVVLDLSRTSTESIDFLPDLTPLRNLVLQKCTRLGQLPEMKTLTSLEVLDISGCEKLDALPEDLSELRTLKELNLSGCSGLKELKEGLFDHMSCLLKLDLSRIKVNRLPSFAKLTSLCRLFLIGLELDSLETPASLSNLVELDLNGLKISSEFTFDFIQTLEKLQILNLSQTSVAKLPDMSKLIKLRELILADCQQLKIVSDLQALINLETLDLSLPDCSTISHCKTETEIEGQTGFYLSVPGCLRKLVLKNRSGVQQLFPLTSLGEMDNLDLRGTDVTEIPYENVVQAKCIQLPAEIDLSGFRFIKMGNLPNLTVLDGNPQEAHLQEPISIASANGSKSSLSAGANQFFHLKEEGNGSWEAFFHQFSVFLPPKGGIDKVIYLDEDELILRGDRSWARRSLNLELKGRSVEIHGFSELPDKIRNVLQEANNVAFVDNEFLRSLSKLCSEPMEVCCIRRCPKMELVLNGEEQNGNTAKCPERLVLSDLVDLKFIFLENVSSKSIKSLKHIHIDCCPKLVNIIIPSQVPKNLETLHIKFCDQLQTLFENITLTKLQKLSLFELPELEGIDADLPQLQTLSISQCPKLKNLGRVVKSASESLTQLCFHSCPSLEHVLPSSPVLQKLEALKISSCSGLVTLFDIAGSSSSTLPKLHILQTLRLWNLPKLNSIGGEVPLVSTPDLDPCLTASIGQHLSYPSQENRNLPM